MRILTIFIDMIRANRLSTFNSKITTDTPFDIAFKELGGTIYTNCFTPGPDTPRGISTFLTGLIPYKNGCNTRLKWPYFFLKKDLSTIFDLFIEHNYKINCFSSLRERDTGLFPEHISKMNIHNKDYNLKKFLNNIKLEKDHFLFIGIPDFHWAFDDFGYTTYGEKKAYKIAKSVYDIIFEVFDKDEFDHIFIFSDHGFKFNAERLIEDKKMMLNFDRTNTILIHRKKGQNELVKNNKLYSLEDFFSTYKQLFGENLNKNEYSFLDENSKREYVILEDHINFTPSVNQNIDLWGIAKENTIYIRNLKSAITVNRENKIISTQINKENDEILKKESSFGIYIDEYEKIFRYRNNILVKDIYMNGMKRKNFPKFVKSFFVLFDFIKMKIKGLND